MQLYCTNCGKGHTQQLKDPWLIVCNTCHHIMHGTLAKTEKSAMPDDWSNIQVGTNGKYKDQKFVVTGRIRIQLKSDFRNLWCAQYGNDVIWIVQSLETIGFFKPPFAPFPNSFGNARAGIYVEFTEQIKLKCELYESCLDIRFEGELAQFPFPNSNFNLMQASNSNGNTVLILYQHANSIQFLWGEILLVNGVTLENTKIWSGWEH